MHESSINPLEKDKQKVHQFGKKTRAGIFIGYVQHAGGGWTGDLNIADWHQIQQSAMANDVHIKRFKADEVQVAWKYDTYSFPVAQGDLRLPEDTKEALIHRVGTEVFYRNKKKPVIENEEAGVEESEDAPHDDQHLHPDIPGEIRPEPSESTQDYWTMQGDLLIRHHRQLRSEMFVPTDDNTPIPVKYLDVMRQTKTSLESPSEKIISDYWTVPTVNQTGDSEPADRELSEPWTGQTVFYLLRQPPPEGHEWCQGRLTRFNEQTALRQCGLKSGNPSLRNKKNKQD